MLTALFAYLVALMLGLLNIPTLRRRQTPVAPPASPAEASQIPQDKTISIQQIKRRIHSRFV